MADASGDEGDARPMGMQTLAVPSFAVSDLPERMKMKSDGKKRKPFVEELEKCKLMEMVQYECDVKIRVERGVKTPKVECLPLVRLFRRCKDSNGEVLTVETTSWESELKR